MIRKHFDLNQKEFADKIGCHRNRISEIERGARDAPKKAILSLCTNLGVDLNWLILGVGRMFQNQSGDMPVETPAQPVNEFGRQIELMEKLLDEKDRLITEKDSRIKLLKQMLS
jgi:transcriptional regulator with XRE-family HTH domain